ncbi:CPBP family intramembrane metalloprotease [candidate division KSB1 bacterium]|nr:MAG: CPBP family intramembrane metalloprotease [candidate division KSB1 bacterium]
MEKNIKKFGWTGSLIIFGSASLLLILETRFLIPFLSRQTGLETVVIWFAVAGLGMFLPMLILASFILKGEGYKITKQTWEQRLRFRKMDKNDWLWTLGSFVLIGILSFGIIKSVEFFTSSLETQPSFMHFDPLTPNRYWILVVWIPYWLLNIMGEEILWRGVILPGQEKVMGRSAWLVNGILWGVFHIAFGWQISLTVIPILLIEPYVVQRRKNTWIGVILHALINGPSFIAIAFGLL